MLTATGVFPLLTRPPLSMLGLKVVTAKLPVRVAPEFPASFAPRGSSGRSSREKQDAWAPVRSVQYGPVRGSVPPEHRGP